MRVSNHEGEDGAGGLAEQPMIATVALCSHLAWRKCGGSLRRRWSNDTAPSVSRRRTEEARGRETGRTTGARRIDRVNRPSTLSLLMDVPLDRVGHRRRWFELMSGLAIVVTSARCSLVVDTGDLVGRADDAGNLQASEASSLLDAEARVDGSDDGRALTNDGSRGDGTSPDGRVIWQDNGHGYLLVVRSSKLSWEAARDEATSQGGHLAVLSTSAENRFVYGALVANQPAAFTGDFGPWIGGKQSPNATTPDGAWQWVTGEPWAYTSWAPNEPNEFQPGEDSLFFYSVGGAKNPQPQWNDGIRSLDISSYIIEFE